MSLVFKFILMTCLCFSYETHAKLNQDLLIGGSYYQRITQVKDVIADVLSPPGYIIESYIVTFLMLNEAENAMTDKKIDSTEMKVIEKLVEHSRQLKEGVSENAEEEGYFSRVEMWNKDLSATNENLKKIKDLLDKSANAPVKEFFHILETKFIPAIKAGDIKKAETIQVDLGTIFLRHKLIVAEVVALAKQNIASFELQASRKEADSVLKGPLYNNIILMKDLIADFLPPPSFIIESYLLSWELVYEVERNGIHSAKIKFLKEKAEKLKSAYILRHNYWAKNLKIPALRDVLIEDAYYPAKKFYVTYDKEFIPALNKGNVVEAKKLVNGRMTSLFKKHRKVIDKLVLAADNKAIEIESEMALQLVKGR